MANGKSRRYSSFRGNAIGSLLDVHFARQGFAAKVKEHMAPLVWAETVGPQIAAATEVERVHDGVLHVAVRSAMWASELSFYKPDILRRLNERVGAQRDPVLRDIRFQNRGMQKKRTPDAPPPLHPTAEELAEVDLSPRELEHIEESIRRLPDEKLRERMRHLRQTDARLRTWRMDNGWYPCPNCGDLAPPPFPPREDEENGRTDCARCRLAAYQRDPHVRSYQPAESPVQEG